MICLFRNGLTRSPHLRAVNCIFYCSFLTTCTRPEAVMLGKLHMVLMQPHVESLFLLLHTSHDLVIDFASHAHFKRTLVEWIRTPWMWCWGRQLWILLVSKSWIWEISVRRRPSCLDLCSGSTESTLFSAFPSCHFGLISRDDSSYLRRWTLSCSSTRRCFGIKW